MCLSWLKKLFAKKLSSNPMWNNLIIGKIVKAEKHPNADRLKVCTVDCGGTTRTIVCGGVNVREGMLTAVAVPGVKVNAGGGEEMEIKQSTIRGMQSDGMLCGPDEIGLLEKFPKKAEKEIIDLSNVAGAKPGAVLSSIL